MKGNRITIKEHFKDIGIEEVIEVEDSLDAYRVGMSKLEIKARAAHASKGAIKLFVYIYNASHGVMYGGSTLV